MTVWPDPPPDGTGLKSWREESNLRSPGIEPGTTVNLVTAALPLRQNGIWAKKVPVSFALV